jgi:hypothetical protein
VAIELLKTNLPFCASPNSCSLTLRSTTVVLPQAFLCFIPSLSLSVFFSLLWWRGDIKHEKEAVEETKIKYREREIKKKKAWL